MTMMFTNNLHAEGWWDHMPAGHRLDIPMNADEFSSSGDEGGATRPASQPNTSPRFIQRSHASAWILFAAVGTTGGALAVATMSDPQGMREHLDFALAEVKQLAGSSPITTTAPATAQAPAPVQDPTPVATAPSTAAAPSLPLDAPSSPIASAAGRGTSHLAPVASIKPVATPAPKTTKEPAETLQVMPGLPPPIALAPVQPLPTVQAPPLVLPPPVPVAPPVAPPPVEEAAPPQPPASSPQ
ncbi:hypothetical protein [Roseateles cavernae]|uniref:hypothetical protein n=1 Tax=Roseateles cavernae TaxID=3153578 RepID=UPI0032E4091F